MADDLKKEIKIIVTKDGVEQAAGSVHLTAEELKKLGVVVDEVKEKNGGLKGAFENLFGEDLGGKILEWAESFGLVMGAIEVVKKGIDFLKSSVDAFQGREKAMLGVESILDSMGKKGEFTSSAILKLAQNMEEFNKYSVKTSDVLGLEGYLLTLDSMTKDKLPRATQAVIDLAAKMKSTDLEGSAKGVAYMLEDVEGGISRLRRSGIYFSDVEKEMIKNMVDHGNKAGALAKTFDLLEEKVGGYARNTTTELEEAKNKDVANIEAIERVIGSLVTSVLTPFYKIMGSIAKAFTPYNSELKESEEKSIRARTQFDVLSATILRLGTQQNKTNAETKAYNDALKEMDDKYDTHLVKLSKEKEAWEKITKAINDTSKALFDKARADAIIAATNDWMTEATVKTKELIKNEYDLSAATLKRDDLFNKGYADRDVNTSQRQSYNKAAIEVDRLKSAIADANQYIQDRASWIQNIKEQNASLFEATITTTAKTTTVLTKAQIEQQKKIDEINARWREKAKSGIDKELQALEEQRNKDIKDAKGNKATLLLIEEGYQNAKADLILKETIKQIELQAETGKLTESTKKAALVTEKEQLETLLKNKLSLESELEIKNKIKNVDNEIKGIAKEKLDYDQKYVSEKLQYDKESYDRKISGYTLSIEDYKNYLKVLLDLDIQKLDDENVAIKEWNKKNPESPKALLDTKSYRTQKENDNQRTLTDYSVKQPKEIADEWKKTHEVAGAAIDGIEAGTNAMWSSFLTNTHAAVNNWDAAWQTMENTAIQKLLAIVENDVWNEIIGLLGSILPSGGIFGNIIKAIFPKSGESDDPTEFFQSNLGITKRPGDFSHVNPTTSINIKLDPVTLRQHGMEMRGVLKQADNYVSDKR